jgi:hypothetical protein
MVLSLAHSERLRADLDGRADRQQNQRHVEQEVSHQGGSETHGAYSEQQQRQAALGAAHDCDSYWQEHP